MVKTITFDWEGQKGAFLGVGSIPYHSQNGGYMGVDTFLKFKSLI